MDTSPIKEGAGGAKRKRNLQFDFNRVKYLDRQRVILTSFQLRSPIQTRYATRCPPQNTENRKVYVKLLRWKDRTGKMNECTNEWMEIYAKHFIEKRRTDVTVVAYSTNLCKIQAETGTQQQHQHHRRNILHCKYKQSLNARYHHRHAIHH